jgi:hypothetical protein
MPMKTFGNLRQVSDISLSTLYNPNENSILLLSDALVSIGMGANNKNLA